MFIFPDFVPQGAAISYVSKQTGLSCEILFMTTASKIMSKSLNAVEKNSFYDFSKTACETENPDIIWQITQVESNFKQQIILIDGKKLMTDEDAVNYLKKGLSKNSNVDIGPLQINWRANGSRWRYQPENFLDGGFSVHFLADRILKTYVQTCQGRWVECYHSYKKNLGEDYSQKINKSGLLLRKLLAAFLQ